MRDVFGGDAPRDLITPAPPHGRRRRRRCWSYGCVTGKASTLLHGLDAQRVAAALTARCGNPSASPRCRVAAGADRRARGARSRRAIAARVLLLGARHLAGDLRRALAALDGAGDLRGRASRPGTRSLAAGAPASPLAPVAPVAPSVALRTVAVARAVACRQRPCRPSWRRSRP